MKVRRRALFEALGDRRVELIAEYRTAMALLAAIVDPGASRSMLEDIVARTAEAPQLRLRKQGLGAGAWVSAQDGRLSEAVHAIAEVLRIGLAIREIPTALADLSMAPWGSLPEEFASEAVTAISAIEAAIERLGLSIPYGFDTSAREAYASALSADAYHDAIRRGRSMSLDEVADHIDALGDVLPETGAPVHIKFPPVPSG